MSNSIQLGQDSARHIDPLLEFRAPPGSLNELRIKTLEEVGVSVNWAFSDQELVLQSYATVSLGESVEIRKIELDSGLDAQRVTRRLKSEPRLLY